MRTWTEPDKLRHGARVAVHATCSPLSWRPTLHGPQVLMGQITLIFMLSHLSRPCAEIVAWVRIKMKPVTGEIYEIQK